MSAAMPALHANRRDLLGRIGLGAAASTAAIASKEAAAARDPHPDWLQLFVEARNRCDSDPDESASERHYEEMMRLEGLVLRTPACTTEGALARVALLADISLVSQLRESEIRPALDNALVLLGISGWRHP